MEKNEAQAELSEIYRLKQELDEEMPSVLSTGKLDRAWGLKAEIERRIQAINEILTPPGSFNKEQKEALEQRGFVIVRLTGESIASQEVKGNKFFSHWYEDFPDFENLPSRLTEVAFNPEPDRFFLPSSYNKTLSQQEEMVDKYSRELQQEIKGVKAIIGEAPDYVELAFGYTGKYGPLFGEEYDFRFTRTKNHFESSVAVVGRLDPGDSLNVSHWNPDDRLDFLWVAPLVVPDDNR